MSSYYYKLNYANKQISGPGCTVLESSRWVWINQCEVLLDMEQVFADMWFHPLPPSSRSPLLTRLPPLTALLDLFPVLSATTSIILLLLPPLISPSVNHTPAPPSLFSNGLLFYVLHVSPKTLQSPSANASAFVFNWRPPFICTSKKMTKALS